MKTSDEIKQQRREIIATTIWWYQNLPQKEMSKEEVEEKAFFAYFNDPIFNRIVQDLIFRLEEQDREIRLEAYKAGMTEAAEIVQHNQFPNQSNPINSSDAKSILAALDNKTSL